MNYRTAHHSRIWRVLVALQLWLLAGSLNAAELRVGNVRLLLPVVRIGEIFDEDFDDIAQLAR
jgi:hypothetical protein